MGVVKRVNLDVERYTERRADRQVWFTTDRSTTVIFGALPDSGRFYARWFGQGPLRDGDCVYDGPAAEYLARRTARRWMRTIGGEWVEA